MVNVCHQSADLQCLSVWDMHEPQVTQMTDMEEKKKKAVSCSTECACKNENHIDLELGLLIRCLVVSGSPWYLMQVIAKQTNKQTNQKQECVYT